MTEIEARGKIKYRIANEMRKAGENKEEYEDLERALQVMKEIREYRELGTVEEFKALKEKNEPKKQGNINDFDSHLRLSKAGFLCCCRTNKDVRYPLISLRDLDYCPRCGQKLDWE